MWLLYGSLSMALEIQSNLRITPKHNGLDHGFSIHICDAKVCMCQVDRFSCSPRAIDQSLKLC